MQWKFMKVSSLPLQKTTSPLDVKIFSQNLTKYKKKLSKVLQTFEDHCVGHTNEAYESYQFHSRRQEEGESIEAYLACLRQLAKTCNFKDEDSMIGTKWSWESERIH
eukprot:GHVL01000639.1.p1 GENE.GHVL01000639.1~~GHVL01000639.1.p1  ORF type:complete len:107 (+),score=8.32 GHVL01000639.1:715-1035(+)